MYLDDVIVFSVLFKEHLKCLASVFGALQNTCRLKLKLSECHFTQREVKYLGHIVSKKAFIQIPEKLKWFHYYTHHLRTQKSSNGYPTITDASFSQYANIHS